MSAPLAERLRPTNLDEIVGQEHLRGKNSVLRNSIESGQIPSMILWGPPGVGKTSIAHVIAQHSNKTFYALSAISSGVKDIREVIEKAQQDGQAILFIDEIHRFSKSQQDALLGAVEKGIINLIGATTENPSFEVNAALLSRCQVYVLKSLNKEQLTQLIHYALQKDSILAGYQTIIQSSEALIRLSGGDARKLLNLLELCVIHAGYQAQIDDTLVMHVAQQSLALYDKSGEQHYDIISAFIKSIRGSDPNAAVYWLARMLVGGEDIKFIARRMLILASEDIGNANPNALLLAQSTFDAVSVIGKPESRIILSQCAIYLACSPKSNTCYLAIDQAIELVGKTGDLPVPLHLRNAPTSLMKELDYGKEYNYDHNSPKNFSGQEFMPHSLEATKLYSPGNNTREEELKKFLQIRWGKKYDY